jgi:hypothetical protein
MIPPPPYDREAFYKYSFLITQNGQLGHAIDVLSSATFGFRLSYQNYGKKHI